MKNKIMEFKPSLDSKHIKVRLDQRTIVMLKDISALEFWKKKYPEAKIMT